jgi:hypothetical protein
MEFTSRVTTADDVDRLRVVMDASIGELQKAFLTDEQIESSRAIMGIDNQLIADGTYYVVEREAACECGWSRRATLYGIDLTPSSSGLRGCNSGSRSRPSLPSLRVVVASLRPN